MFTVILQSGLIWCFGRPPALVARDSTSRRPKAPSDGKNQSDAAGGDGKRRRHDGIRFARFASTR